VQQETDESALAEERMASVERQLHKHVPKGIAHMILCPYCSTWNHPRTRKFCCDLLRKAIIAVLSADKLKHNAEIAERAMNN